MSHVPHPPSGRFLRPWFPLPGACVIVVGRVGRASALGMTAGIDPRSAMEWRRPGETACVIVVSSAPGRYTRGIGIRDDRSD